MEDVYSTGSDAHSLNRTKVLVYSPGNSSWLCPRTRSIIVRISDRTATVGPASAPSDHWNHLSAAAERRTGVAHAPWESDQGRGRVLAGSVAEGSNFDFGGPHRDIRTCASVHSTRHRGFVGEEDDDGTVRGEARRVRALQ